MTVHHLLEKLVLWVRLFAITTTDRWVIDIHLFDAVEIHHLITLTLRVLIVVIVLGDLFKLGADATTNTTISSYFDLDATTSL